jgi:heterodisulfide reductase subunit A2
MKRVAIIGGGVAGLSAAMSLQERGVPSVIIERDDELGGLCGKLGCKGVERCVRCDACLARNLVAQVKSSPKVERLMKAELLSVSGHPGDFRLTVKENKHGRGHGVRAGAIICAIGGEPFDARMDKRLGYGEVQDVITSFDLERQLSEKGAATVPSTGLPPTKVAFILCVGSRDERFNTGYCSKACCKSSFKLAQALRTLAPGCNITFFFMDWRLYDPRENVRVWSSGEDGVRLIRSRPCEVVLGEGPKPEVHFALEGDTEVGAESFDMVVLSIGTGRAKGSAELAQTLQIETDVHGFMRSINIPCASTRPGIFLAGVCKGPKEILECAKEGAIAASRAMEFLEGTR